jgi:DNA-binding transcriptional regulator YhcF (GntR family)
MLEHLFGSKTRVLLLRLFLNNPDDYFFIRELSRRLGAHLNSVRRELDNLEKIGIITSHTKQDLEREVEKKLKDKKKYYKLNTNFVFVEELRALLIKAQLILEQSLVKKVEKLGSISFFLLSGIFVGRPEAAADLLIVGRVNRRRLTNLIKSFERELGQEIRYSVLSVKDFQYRRDVTDKFLYDLLEGKNLIIIDYLTHNI